MALRNFLAPIAAFALSATAQATVLTFDGLTSEAAVLLNSVSPAYGGLSWGNTWALFDTSAYGAPVNSGNYGIVNNTGTSPEAITIASSSTMTFNGVYIGGWPFNAPASILIEGLDALDNVIAGNSISVSLSNSSPLQYVNADWAGVTSVRFTGGQYYTLDDFTFNEGGTVPEPTTIALVALALLGGAAASRRKRT
jgi:hypothetical protein